MVFALIVKIVLNAVYKRVNGVIVVLVDYHSGLFVNKENVFVLVNNVKLRWHGEKIIVRNSFLFLQKFVVDVKLYSVIFAKLIVGFSALVIYLYTLFPHRLADKALT